MRFSGTSGQSGGLSAEMNRSKSIPPVVLAVLGFLTVGWSADLDSRTNAEIEHLLGYLKDSGCRFQRNGKWHDVVDAHKHIERKLNWLLKRDLVTSTEEFIERAASESSRSGEPYVVQCPNGGIVESRDWLTAELVRWRRVVHSPAPASNEEGCVELPYDGG
jgi:hypothetical protein